MLATVFDHFCLSLRVSATGTKVVLLDVYEGPDNPVVMKTLKQHKQFLLGCTRWFCYGFGAAIMWRILN
jgi:hypothetical protein